VTGFGFSVIDSPGF